MPDLRRSPGSCCPSFLGPLEPQVHLTRAGGGFVLAVLRARRGAGRTADRSDHHQVVREEPLRGEATELVIACQDRAVVARFEAGDQLLVTAPGLGTADVFGPGGLVIA